MILEGLKEYDNDKQNQALINEFKGNLFEYLIAQKLARFYNIEIDFLKSIDTEYRKQLMFYENWMRKNAIDIFKALPILANETFNNIQNKLPKTAKLVQVLGKTHGNIDEADVRVTISDDVRYDISLKLCKKNAFVNTKSGGVKSFIEKYFADFEDATLFQKEFNSKVDRHFEYMASNLHELAGLNYESGFGVEWISAGLTELPGSLPPEMSNYVQEFYQNVAKDLYGVLINFYTADRAKFSQCLFPLIGLSSKSIHLLTCFHKNNHEFDRVILESRVDFDLNSLVFEELKSGISSFQLLVGDKILQIRLKAMNKFTVPALKVNCSVKNGK